METHKKRIISAKDPEARMNQLINLAVNLTEEKLRDKTATSQMITSLLKLATTKEQLENEKLRSDLKVANAKITQMETSNDVKQLYQKALNAMRSYSGEEILEEEDQDALY